MPSKTSRSKLSHEDFDALLRLSETATAITGMPELLRLFPLNWPKILASGAFYEEEHALTVVPPGSDQEKDVEWNDDVGGYAYFSVRGWVKIDANLLRRYKLNTQWVVDQILQALSWPQKAEHLLDGVLWNCGQSYIGKKRVTLFVGRRVAHPEVFTDIQKKLTPRCRSGAHVLLTTSQHSALAQRMSDRAVKVITASEAGELLPRITNDPEHFECNFCAWRERCWSANHAA